MRTYRGFRVADHAPSDEAVGRLVGFRGPDRHSYLADPVTGALLSDRAKAYNRRRKTPPLTKEQAAAIVEDRDPVDHANY